MLISRKVIHIKLGLLLKDKLKGAHMLISRKVIHIKIGFVIKGQRGRKVQFDI